MKEKDRTAMTEPLTTGQKIVAWWETSTSASEPADLAEKIDAELDRIQRLSDIYNSNLTAAIADVDRLRAALRKIAGSMIGTGQNSRVLVEIAREALGDG